MRVWASQGAELPEPAVHLSGMHKWGGPGGSSDLSVGRRWFWSLRDCRDGCGVPVLTCRSFRVGRRLLVCRLRSRILRRWLCDKCVAGVRPLASARTLPSKGSKKLTGTESVSMVLSVLTISTTAQRDPRLSRQ